MAPAPSSKPTFSPARRWTIGFNVVLSIVAVIAVVVMVNYLGANYLPRFYISSLTRVELSPRTLSILHSLTNRVEVTLYYDKDQPLYSDITELLKEYSHHNPQLVVRTVDYYRDPGAAQELRAKYNLGSSTNKDFVIFDCEGRTRFVDGNALAQYLLEPVTGPDAKPGEREFRRKPIYFLGEEMFTAALLTVVNPKPLQAYFLQGHGEARPDDPSDIGFMKFASVLQQNSIRVNTLNLLGTNTVPADCNLLIIAGPTDPIPRTELDRIEQYLNDGGRLLVLFNVYSLKRPTGLESLLAKWGVQVGGQIVTDPENSVGGTDVMVGRFASHPVVNPLLGSRLEMILPREIQQVDVPSAAGNGPKSEEIAFTGPKAFLQTADLSKKLQTLPLMVAVEKDAVKGVIPQRGTMRMLVVGDSLCLDNQLIEVAANRDFAGYAANWLLERNLLLQGIGPRPVTEFRLLMTHKQLQTAQWILLAAMPGGVLLLGGAVWLRRRS
jgi:hypothetical protein